MGFTNPAAAATAVTVSGTVGVNSAPSGAVPGALFSHLSAAPAVVGTFHLIPQPFSSSFMLNNITVTLLNLLDGAYLTLTIQDTNGNVLLGPFFAYGTTGTNTPHAAGIEGKQFDMAQYVLNTAGPQTGLDVVIAGSPGSASAWAVDVEYVNIAGGFPGHIITA